MPCPYASWHNFFLQVNMKHSKDIAELKFKPLKQYLQKLFKEMQFDVDDGISPASSQISDFIQQVEIMVSYPGFGDENYSSFLEEARKLGELPKNTPLSVWVEHFRRIDTLHRHCHSRLRYL